MTPEELSAWAKPYILNYVEGRVPTAYPREALNLLMAKIYASSNVQQFLKYCSHDEDAGALALRIIERMETKPAFIKTLSPAAYAEMIRTWLAGFIVGYVALGIVSDGGAIIRCDYALYSLFCQWCDKQPAPPLE